MKSIRDSRVQKRDAKFEKHRAKYPNPDNGGNNMAGNNLTIKLTDDQQNQIKSATGKSVTELNIDLSSNLADKDLDNVAGGCISWKSPE